MINGEYLGQATAEYVGEHFDELGITEAGLAAEDIDGFDPIVGGFLDNLSDDINLHFEERFSSDITDFSPILDQGESDDIQIMFTFLSQGGDALMTQWAQREPNYVFGAGDIFSSEPDRWENTDSGVEYVWSYAGGAAPGLELTETTNQFIDDHRELFDGDAPPHAQAYSQHDAILTWVEAVEEAGTMDENEVAATITDISVEGVTGTLDWYDENGKFQHTPRFGEDYFHPPVMQWQEDDGDGEQVGLYPEPVRDGDLEIPPWVDL